MKKSEIEIIRLVQKGAKDLLSQTARVIEAGAISEEDHSDLMVAFTLTTAYTSVAAKLFDMDIQFMRGFAHIIGSSYIAAIPAIDAEPKSDTNTNQAFN
jgi:hypothetical protein